MKYKVAPVLFALVFLFLAADSGIAQELKISYPGLTGDSSPLWIAKEAGVFHANGIDAELIYMEGGRLSIQGLLSESTQFMSGDAVSALTAIAGGADILLLGSAKNLLPYVFAVSERITRPEDLKGKTIAISQVGGRAGEIARMIVKSMGLNPDADVKYLSLGGSQARLAALSKGSVQAAPVERGLTPRIKKAGLKVLDVKPIPFIVDALWTTRQYADANPGMVDRVIKSYVKGIAIDIENRDVALKVFRKYTKIDDPKFRAYAYETYIAGLDRVPIPSDEAIQNTIEMSLRLAPQLKNLDVKKHFYFGPVQKLKDEGYIKDLYK
jgi:ABC-type nitrate/sulfonate/bicarbonate transport system substrate-binding protein